MNKRKRLVDIILWVTCIIVLLLFFLFLLYMKNKSAKTKPVFEELTAAYIKIKCDQNEINVGERIELIIDSDIEKVYLFSSNSKAIKLENNSIIGLKAGSAKIYAKSGNIKSNVLKINCISRLKEIKLSETQIDLLVGEEKTINAKLIPEDATYKVLEWKTSNENVAIVENGIIKGISKGEAIITVTNSENIKQECKVIVKEIEVEKLSLDETSVELRGRTIIYSYGKNRTI